MPKAAVVPDREQKSKSTCIGHGVSSYALLRVVQIDCFLVKKTGGPLCFRTATEFLMCAFRIVDGQAMAFSLQFHRVTVRISDNARLSRTSHFGGCNIHK